MARSPSALERLDDGRLRVEKGPMSLVIAARWAGRPRAGELVLAGRYALQILDELAAHRALLGVDARRIRNPVALPPVVRAMWEAAARFPDRFVTPLVAVAGTVADFVADFLVRRGATWAVVSNGGDVALRLAPGERASVGVVERVSAPAPAARFEVGSGDGVGGVATSGLGGRSLTLGVADAVVVAASSASVADACATLVANQVNVDSPAVCKAPAEEVDPATDLKGLEVTVGVGRLESHEVAAALDRGEAEARQMLEAGHIRGAILSLRGERRFVGWPGEEGVEGFGRWDVGRLGR